MLKNFSIFLGPGGTYRLTPLDDVLTAQPSLDARQIELKQMKLAMAVGAKNHYRIDEIHTRQFFETGKAAGFSNAAVQTLIDEIREAAGEVTERLADELTPRFRKSIHVSVRKAVTARLRILSAGACYPEKAMSTPTDDAPQAAGGDHREACTARAPCPERARAGSCLARSAATYRTPHRRAAA